MKTWIALILLILLDSAGGLCLSKAMKQVGDLSQARISDWRAIANRLTHNPLLWLGTLFQAGTFFLLLALLSWVDLSIVTPIAAFGYVTSTLGAQFILKENVTRQRWSGTLLICLGVALVSLSISVG